MRKLIGVVVTLAALTVPGVAMAGAGATNPAGDFLDLSMSATPPIASVGSVGITADAFAGNRINGDTPFGSTSIALLFNKGFKYNGKQFPACTLANNVITCATKAKIGSGTAEAELLGANGAPPSFIAAQVQAFNGNPVGGKPSIDIFATVNGKVAATDQFIETSPQAGYGLEFKTSTASPSSTLETSQLDVTIPAKTIAKKAKGTTTQIPLLQAPTTCTGTWRFALSDTFASGPPLTATDTEPCVAGVPTGTSRRE